MEPNQIVGLVQAGGVLAFAALVYYQLTLFRREMEAHRKEESETREELAGLREILAAMLERDRTRDDLTPPQGTLTPGMLRKPSAPPEGFAIDVVKIPRKKGDG